MRLQLFEYPEGVEIGGGNSILYDVDRNEAHFGPATVEGRALHFELAGKEDARAELSAPVDLDPGEGWLLRCDRVDFPLNGVAYLHTHAGPGIRCLLHGAIRIDTEGRSTPIGPFGSWFESGAEPVYAAASEWEETAFVRVMVLPRRLLGQSSIRYVNEEDGAKPKSQRYTVFVDQPIELR